MGFPSIDFFVIAAARSVGVAEMKNEISQREKVININDDVNKVHNNNDEEHYFSSTDDLGAMDYTPASKKPPIHN